MAQGMRRSETGSHNHKRLNTTDKRERERYLDPERLNVKRPTIDTGLTLFHPHGASDSGQASEGLDKRETFLRTVPQF